MSNADSNAFLNRLRPIDQRVKNDPLQKMGKRARTEIQEIRDQAREEGHDEGYLDGFSRGQQEGLMQGQRTGHTEAKKQFEAEYRDQLDEFAGALNQTIYMAQASIETWMLETEDRLADMAIEIARRAIQQELAIGRDSVVEIVRGALEEVVGGRQVRLRINPVDAGLIEARRSDLIESVSGITQIEIITDKTVEVGCRLETEAGVIDATVEGYLERLQEDVEDAA